MEHTVRQTHHISLNSDEMLALYEAVKVATKNGADKNHILNELLPILSNTPLRATVTLDSA